MAVWCHRRVGRGAPALAVPYIGLDALLKNKRAAGRPKDQDDLVYLEAARARKNLG